MKNGRPDNSAGLRRPFGLRLGRWVSPRGLKAGGFAAVLGLTAWSAILAKEATVAPLLANIQTVRAAEPVALPIDLTPQEDRSLVVEPDVPEDAEAPAPAASPAEPAPSKWGNLVNDPSVRWFNGRPARPARVVWMTVTGYSPDEKSCGASADGLTATLHSVYTNAFRLVAADPRVLPYGSMVSVPGYDEERIVPVLDCGAAIKGNRLDLLFPTDAQARAWGVKRLKIVVWRYIDGHAAGNPRAER